jgi:hypothetical protein
MPDPTPRPQPPPQPARPRRFWLWAPYALVLIALIAWSGVWWAMRAQLQSSLTRNAAVLRAHGYDASWSGLDITGWPFRLDVTLTAPRIAEPSGWVLAAPRLVGEGLPYAPDHWIFVAPDGLALTRPGKGVLGVTGQAIRASIGGLGSPRPRLSFEGLKLVLTPAKGAAPAPFAAADRLELHLQPGPDDQAALLIRLDGASLTPASALARLAPRGAFGLVWDSRLSRLSALNGRSWPAALQAWAATGGVMSLVDIDITLGRVGLHGASGALTVGPDGRLRGAVPLTLGVGRNDAQGEGLSSLGALLLAGPVDLSFEGGRAALGPISLGRALKVG